MRKKFSTFSQKSLAQLFLQHLGLSQSAAGSGRTEAKRSGRKGIPPLVFRVIPCKSDIEEEAMEQALRDELADASSKDAQQPAKIGNYVEHLTEKHESKDAVATVVNAGAGSLVLSCVKKTAGILLGIELVILALLVALCMAPKLFGIDTYGILTGSMRPAFNVGDLVYVDTGVSGEDLQVGDVAAFDAGEGRVVTHRVTATDPESRTITTKGDANAAEDVNPVGYDAVFGRTVGSVPSLGGIVQSFTDDKSRWLLSLGAVTVALAALSTLLPDCKSRKS